MKTWTWSPRALLVGLLSEAGFDQVKKSYGSMGFALLFVGLLADVLTIFDRSVQTIGYIAAAVFLILIAVMLKQPARRSACAVPVTLSFSILLMCVLLVTAQTAFGVEERGFTSGAVFDQLIETNNQLIEEKQALRTQLNEARLSPALTTSQHELAQYLMQATAAAQKGEFIEAEQKFNQYVRQKLAIGNQSYAEASHALVQWSTVGVFGYQDKAYVDKLTEATQLDPTNDRAWAMLGLSRAKSGLYMDAIEAFRNMLHFRNDNSVRSSGYANMGFVYVLVEDYEQAETMYLNSLKIDESRGDEKGVATNYGNLAHIAMLKEDYDEAIELLHRAIYVNRKWAHQIRLARNYANLANASYRIGSIEDARRALDQASSILAARDRENDNDDEVVVALEAIEESISIISPDHRGIVELVLSRLPELRFAR
ncbi:MAG: tetratricopeptide repeat protein [Woeseiaceae bacterium]|nr:tetratricopeptide repeat protein [Woeseiaceae bacterium]